MTKTQVLTLLGFVLGTVLVSDTGLAASQIKSRGSRAICEKSLDVQPQNQSYRIWQVQLEKTEHTLKLHAFTFFYECYMLAGQPRWGTRVPLASEVLMVWKWNLFSTRKYFAPYPADYAPSALVEIPLDEILNEKQTAQIRNGGKVSVRLQLYTGHLNFSSNDPHDVESYTRSLGSYELKFELDQNSAYFNDLGFLPK